MATVNRIQREGRGQDFTR